MKKITIVMIALIISVAAFSQKKVSGGLYVGTNLSWYTFNSRLVVNDGVKLGYQFGAMLDYNLIDNFALSTGINFNSMGGSQTYTYGVHNFTRNDLADTTTGNGSTIKYKMDYLEIPIGFKGKTNEIGYFTYFMKAGVTPGVNISAKADVTVNSNDIITAERKLFNMGWYLGAGFEWSLQGNTRFITEVLYTGGIFDTDKTEVSRDDNTSANVRASLSSVALKVGILF